MLKRYIYGLAIMTCVVGILLIIFGFFLALIGGFTWTYFWVGLILTIVTAPTIYAFEGVEKN